MSDSLTTCAEFPHMKGFDRRNLFYMRSYAQAWSGPEPIVQTVSAQLSWSHNIALLEKVKDQEAQQWYAAQAVQRGWSLSALAARA
ncbi:DUF1016 N-terminal domain-containing protein [Sinomonas sp. JGH33]|uniref:DUF1016 N-terminal domain-containing protein n=1 Tax=Sinomonas terricola TaxID=3110330 RepID=A0ABU5T2C5_9MICC|nr:DUF1016 N-terminal domain-containing protein [Sinomonas sp. JGH33]MEA5453725.1 DUF1016 N-terminal domain-containing protein [Sinomonas sp. JGH33]